MNSTIASIIFVKEGPGWLSCQSLFLVRSVCLVFDLQVNPVSFLCEGKCRTLASTKKDMLTLWTSVLYVWLGRVWTAHPNDWIQFDFTMYLAHNLPYPQGCSTLVLDFLFSLFEVKSTLRPNVARSSAGSETCGHYVRSIDSMIFYEWKYLSLGRKIF